MGVSMAQLDGFTEDEGHETEDYLVLSNDTSNEHWIMLLHSSFRGGSDLNTTPTAFGSGEFNTS